MPAALRRIRVWDLPTRLFHWLLAACVIASIVSAKVLELFATEGLNPEAVHKTRLRIGEGIIGDIAAHARALALSDAPADPRFAYRPETGEEPYLSMLGVPILRAGKEAGDYGRQLESSEDAAKLDALEQKGLLKRIPFEDREEMKARVDPVMAEYAADIGVAEIYQQINAIK